jgi:hypothetical protein
MDALEDMRGGDVVHVEGRVLAQQHHVHPRQVLALLLAEREMAALLVLHRHRLDAGEDLAVHHGEPVGRVVEERVPAPLRFQHQRESRVAGDVDGRDVIHLDGDFERHFLNSGKAPGAAVRSGPADDDSPRALSSWRRSRGADRDPLYALTTSRPAMMSTAPTA